MMGNPEDVGLIPRMNDELFTRLADKLETMRRDAESSDTKVMITVRKESHTCRLISNSSFCVCFL